MSKSQRRLLAVNIVVHSLSLSRQMTRLADKFVTLHDYAVYIGYMYRTCRCHILCIIHMNTGISFHPYKKSETIITRNRIQRSPRHGSQSRLMIRNEPDRTQPGFALTPKWSVLKYPYVKMFRGYRRKKCVYVKNSRSGYKYSPTPLSVL